MLGVLPFILAKHFLNQTWKGENEYKRDNTVF